MLLILFVLDLFEFCSGLFDICLFAPKLDMDWEDSIDLTLLLMFLGLAISCIGGFVGLFIGGVAVFRKFLLS